MSRRARAFLVCGCLCVSALHVPRAARAAQAGWQGPYAEDGEAATRVTLAEQTPREGESLARASLFANPVDGIGEGPGGGM